MGMQLRAGSGVQVLQYLGDRRPPVTHRDVKPENVVLGGGQAGGRVFLVDFGGVQARHELLWGRFVELS